MSILVNLAGLVLIATIVWWFWLYQPREAAQAGQGAVVITVKDGVYTPNRIRIRRNDPVELTFLRQDQSPCAGTVIFDGLDISEDLPVNQPREISLTVDKPGTYEFACQMKMYRGELVVEEA